MEKNKQDQIREEAIRSLAKIQSMGSDPSAAATTRYSHVDPAALKENENQIRRLLEPGSSFNLDSSQEESYETKKVIVVILAAIGTVGIGYAIYWAILSVISQ